MPRKRDTIYALKFIEIYSMQQKMSEEHFRIRIIYQSPRKP